ncbi:hypothetical protein JHD50_01835 [Sulfurimonas sp. MAG313]|nr:hypothetical protein [Sulfurimonas sp. MAG313]MDF1880050.1 hypothetical protein [Sulfurimonas sp. MAG313]
MTKLLDSAINEIQDLPELEQNIMAKFILDEIHSEKKWDVSFSDSENLLASLADEALDSLEEGTTEQLNIDKL